MSEELDNAVRGVEAAIKEGMTDLPAVIHAALLIQIARQLERIADALERAADDAAELVQ